MNLCGSSYSKVGLSAPKFRYKTLSCARISDFYAHEPGCVMWVRAAAHCKELHAALPPDTALRPREVDLCIAGAEETGLWNNQNVVQLKSNGI